MNLKPIIQTYFHNYYFKILIKTFLFKTLIIMIITLKLIIMTSFGVLFTFLFCLKWALLLL